MEAKRPGRDVAYLSPSSAEVKNEWSYISTPPCTIMAWAGIKIRVLLVEITHINDYSVV